MYREPFDFYKHVFHVKIAEVVEYEGEMNAGIATQLFLKYRSIPKETPGEKGIVSTAC